MVDTISGNETSNYELEFETKSGEIRYLLLNVSCLTLIKFDFEITNNHNNCYCRRLREEMQTTILLV